MIESFAKKRNSFEEILSTYLKKTFLTCPRSPQHQMINVERDNRLYPSTKQIIKTFQDQYQNK